MTYWATVPNSWRRLFAEIIADAEDRGLGTWTEPVFEAAPGKVDEARAFIETRTDLLAEKRLATPTAVIPIPEDLDYEINSVVYDAVLTATAASLKAGTDPDAVGLAAWESLTDERRRDAFANLMSSYVDLLLRVERDTVHAEVADNPAISTVLGTLDEDVARDAVLEDNPAAPGPGETTINKQILFNLLEEIELLRRRTTEATP